MGITFQRLQTSDIQIIGTIHMNFWVYISLFFIIVVTTQFVINELIKRKKFERRAVENRVLELNTFGAFIITFALSANSALRFGDLPSAVSLFNPLLGFYPIYIAYLLQVAINEGRIK